MKPNDIMHFYFGCEVGVNEGEHFQRGIFWGFHDFEKTVARIKFRSGPDGHVNMFFIKPILRSVSNLTDEELLMLVKFYFSPATMAATDLGIVGIKRINDLKHKAKYGTSIPVMILDAEGRHNFPYTFSKDSMNAAQFMYLTQQRIDVFDLIENKQAIDATE